MRGRGLGADFLYNRLPNTGPSSIISFLIAGTACGGTIPSYAEFTAMVPAAGSTILSPTRRWGGIRRLIMAGTWSWKC